MDTTDKIHENRLRRMAERRGLRLEKSSRRDPDAIDFGTYRLRPNWHSPTANLDRDLLTIDQVEAYLHGQAVFHRTVPGEHVDAEAGAVVTVKPGVVLDIARTGQKLIAQDDGTLRELTAEELAEELPAGAR